MWIKLALCFFVATTVYFATLFHAKNESKPSGTAVENFSLLDSNGDHFELFRHAQDKAVVLIARRDGCPLLKKNVPSLRRLMEKYQAQGVQFYFIDPNRPSEQGSSPPDEVLSSLKIPTLLDRAQIVSKSLGIKVSGEVLVITPSPWRISYQGAIDDRLDYAGERIRAENHFLASAIDSVMKGETPEVRTTLAKGCAITYEDSPVTFAEIAPIISRRCSQCHAPGLVEPTNMLTFEDLKNWSSMIRQVIRTQSMPPWPLDPRYGHVRDDPSMTPTEISQVIRWIESGTPYVEGKDPHRISVKSLPEDPPPDFRLTSTRSRRMAEEGILPYQYYEMGQIKEDLYFSTIKEHSQLGPDSAHHYAVVWSAKKLTSEKEIMDKTRLATAQSADFFFTPKFAYRAPAGTAYFIPKNSYIYLEGHYEANGKVQIVQPQLEFWKFKGDKPKIVKYYNIEKFPLDIPPRSIVDESNSWTVDHDIHLVEIRFHTHGRGVAVKLAARTPDGSTQTLVSAPRWKFKGPNVFTLEKPILIKKGTQLIASFRYDNTANNPANPDPNVSVHSGSHIMDEMASVMCIYYEADEFPLRTAAQ